MLLIISSLAALIPLATRQSSLVIFLLRRSDIVAVATVLLKLYSFSGILFAIN